MNILIIAVGFAAGIISGMGIGGGTVLIPALTLLCGIDHKTAQCVNLMYFIPTAAAALIIHIKKKNIEWKSVLPMLAGGVIGSIIGSYAAVCINPIVLRKMFGIFLAILAIRELYTAKKSAKLDKNLK